MENLRSQIAHLRSVSPQLNRVTDQAARLVSAVENFLNDECQFSIPAYVIMSRTDHPDGSDDQVRLEYARLEGKFKLLVSEVSTDPGGESYVQSKTAWSACPRDMKLWSIEHIPALLVAIEKRIERTISGAEKASKNIEDLLHAIGASTGEEKR